MITTDLFPGRYVQGAGAIEKMSSEMKRFGEKGFVICDPFVHDELLDGFREPLERDVDTDIERFEGECCDPEIERLAGKARECSAEFVVGLGGGKTLDTAKIVARDVGLPVLIVPTLASTDAPCSALGVVYTPEGEFSRYEFLPSNPNVVLIDTAMIAAAPTRFLLCGMGDALATWFEADTCRRAFAGNMSGDPGSRAAYALARLCYDTLLEYGRSALIACEAGHVTPALDHIVEANTLLSGLGFESGGLAACHSIHNGLTVLEDTHDLYHGEKVAFGVAASLFLEDRDRDTIDEVYDFCDDVGLPTTLEGIGLKKATDDDLLKVAQAACAEGETIHNEPMPVEPRDVVAAMRAADGEGRRREED